MADSSDEETYPQAAIANLDIVSGPYPQGDGDESYNDGV